VFIIFPKWKHLSELPVATFQYATGRQKGLPIAAYIAAYDTFAAGRRVLDTLMDAFSFFDRCDPSIADRDDDGNLRGFLLPPLPIGEYHRLGPDWPDHAVVEHKIRTDAGTEKPHGAYREITGWISTDQGVVYCGHTVDGPRRTSFTELDHQVERDVIDLGYSYYVDVPDAPTAVTQRSGKLKARGANLEAAVPEFAGSQLEPWKGWWDLCATDANYYRRQRRGT
jgi:hypothetical protein